LDFGILEFGILEFRVYSPYGVSAAADRAICYKSSHFLRQAVGFSLLSLTQKKDVTVSSEIFKFEYNQKKICKICLQKTKRKK